MGNGATVLRDRKRAYDDGAIAKVRILAVPPSQKFPTGRKYAYHYGAAGVDHPIIRFDNHHGPHELHLGPATFEIDFPGFRTLGNAGWLHSRPRNATTGGDSIAGAHPDGRYPS